MTPAPPAIILDAATWPGALARANPDPQARAFRQELGLPHDRPLAMSGHQPWLWHGGILSKVIALRETMSSLGVAGAWVWVDQDSIDPGSIVYPAHGADGSLRRAAWRVAGPPAGDVALSGLPPWPEAALAPAPGDLHPACAPDALGLTRRALARAASSPSLGAQWARALEHLCTQGGFALGGGDAAAGGAPRTFPATSIARTSLFRMMLRRMADDPRRAAETYNAAASADPGAGIRPLRTGAETELPIWRLVPGEPRRPLFAGELRAPDADTSLAPRALLMTGLLRWAGCELFIHGTGGGRYDRITETWFYDWLGARLAPSTVVSADLHLPLISGPAPTAREVAQARGLAHRARHDPGLLGDPAGAAQKQALVAEIQRLRAAGGNPAPAFAAMHRVIAASRARAPERLAALDDAARDTARLYAFRDLALARDWPWVLATPGLLQSLRAAIDAALRECVR